MNAFEIDYLRENQDYLEESKKGFQDLMVKATHDWSFREGLLINPGQTLKEYSGMDFPSEYDVRFIENEADVTIVLPDYIDESAEISEAELETVAGGASNPTPTTTTVCSAIAVTALTLWAWDEFVEQD